MMQDLIPTSSGDKASGPSLGNRCRAFTLTELLVVIGIIVLVMAMAVPAFNYVTGSRSQESASNIISAMLGRARNMAVSNARHTGVFFRLDPLTDRTVLYIVERDAGASRDPDPLDRYKSWRVAGGSAKALNYLETPFRDRAIFMSVDLREQFDTTDAKANDDSYAETDRLYTKVYSVRKKTEPSSSTNSPVPAGTAAGVFENDYWAKVSEGDLDLASGMDSEAQVLPAGVGAQLLNDTTDDSPTKDDQYVRTGLILFDPQGRLELVDCHVDDDSALGRVLNMTASSNAEMAIRSAPGLVLYDLSTFRAQIAPSGEEFTDVDISSELLSGGVTTISSSGDESIKEAWLNSNANVLMVNRASGALTEVK